MIDAHCHLQFHLFENDYKDVINRALTAGITRIINVGTKIDSSKKAVELAEEFSELYAVIGIHPHHADKLLDDTNIEINKKDWYSELSSLAAHPKVIGIGEIGLDYFSYKSNGIVDPKIQKELFIRQIELASTFKLPLQIHNRQAGKDILEVLKKKRSLLNTVPGMFHCFAGDEDILRAALDLGFYIGFDGNVTYKGLAPGEKTELSTLAKLVPLDRLIVETDSPFLTPIPFRGTRNEPARVITTGKYLSMLKGIVYETLEDQVIKNVYTIFPKLK